MLFFRLFSLVSVVLALSACSDEQVLQDAKPTVRAIKHMTLTQRAGLQQRRIAGVVTAAVSTNVGFEINGQIIELLRKVGDHVDSGELIARLDPEPSRLRLSQSENSIPQARATLDDARKNLNSNASCCNRAM
jgi:multidrug efflux pump subunit AcrA (membrane-fusion protein)